MTPILEQLQSDLHREIPITRHMGITLVDYDDRRLTISAPLDKNINHRDTAFGGSLNTLATLAGWCLLNLITHSLEKQLKIVVQDSTIRYIKPVMADFEATCRKPDRDELDRFLKTLRRKGRARIGLRSEISENGEPVVVFVGRYVVYII